MAANAPFDRRGLSPVAGKPVQLAFDGGRSTSDAGVLPLAEIERVLQMGIAIGADAGLDLALRRMSLAHQATPAAAVLELGVRPQERIEFGLDHLLQHSPRSRPQHLGQRIVRNAASALIHQLRT